MNSSTASRLPIHPLEPSEPPRRADSSPYYIPGRLNLLVGGSSHRRHSDIAALPERVQSRSIPISGGMKRTPSEKQLCEDEEMADFRDYVMFSRIVDGIERQQRETQDYWLRRENDMCLAHIIGTRNGSEDDLPPQHGSPIKEQRLTRGSSKRESLRKILEHPLPAEQEEDEIFAIDL